MLFTEKITRDGLQIERTSVDGRSATYSFHRNKKLRAEIYAIRWGARMGLCRWYNSDGEIYSQEYYINDEVEGESLYHDDIEYQINK